MSELHQRILADIKVAMKARDGLRTVTLRSINAALKNEKIAAQRELFDEDVVRILRKNVKSRSESVTMFRQGNREDLASKEEAEIEIIQTYLPKLMSPTEIQEATAALIQELGITSPKGLGLFMKEFMKRFQGRADGKMAQQAARNQLG